MLNKNIGNFILIMLIQVVMVMVMLMVITITIIIKVLNIYSVHHKINNQQQLEINH